MAQIKGISKKKQIRYAKAKAKVSPKAKKKAKAAQKVHGREQKRESKRQANEAVRQKFKKDTEGLESIKSVDDLFASIAGEEGDEEDVANQRLVTGKKSKKAKAKASKKAPAAEEDSDDESSAGAFHDVGDAGEGDDDDMGDDDEEEEAMPKHEDELKAIKQADPEFYKFLIEQDKSLLDFQDPDDEDEDGSQAGEHGEEEKADEDEDGPEVPTGNARVLTKERLDRIHSHAKESFTACKAALNVFHFAVRSINAPDLGMPQEENGEDEEPQAAAKTSGKEKTRFRDKARGIMNPKQRPSQKRHVPVMHDGKHSKSFFVIDDEKIFSEVIEWSMMNLLPTLRHHLEKDPNGGGSSASGKKKKGKKEGAFDPSDHPRWTKIQRSARIFWLEAYVLLTNLKDPNLLDFVLKQVSTEEAMQWLWPFRQIREKYLKHCCFLWANGPQQSTRLVAFLFLRNAGAMMLQQAWSDRKYSQMYDNLLRLVIRSFADTAAQGYSWARLNHFRFLENCMVELLKLDDATAYRIAYVCLRQLALILRNATLSTQTNFQARPGADGKLSKQQKKQKAAFERGQAIQQWPFVRALSLWTRAISSLPSLKALAYPLAMIELGAAKHRMLSVQHFPFVYHCMTFLNRMSASMETYVPIASHLLKTLDTLLTAMDSKKKKKGSPNDQKKTLDSKVKAPDMEVTLRLKEDQAAAPIVLESVGQAICNLLLEHLGLLSQSPAFPEVATPVLMHLRKHKKHCKSEPLRRQVLNLVQKAEESAAAVRAKREALTELPDATKFLLFEPDTAIAKARLEMHKRRSADEQRRIQAEESERLRRQQQSEKEKKEELKKLSGIEEDGDGEAEADEDEGDDDEEMQEGDEEGEEETPAVDPVQAKKEAKKRRNNEKQREKKKRAKVLADREREVAAIPGVIKAAGSLPDKDKIEEMKF
mmetsp:Transcript_81947/g.171476  ORF Transcript_81947/g.171476 Transcript_81947/m.171476 type:complete len:932 (-) Transcript_81947:184-2979(-)|eukprot:CAMPEP_0206449876 /NCGR_PEP_ID=MMETSP0324_2-20121206/18371_1 /ASSEMBLY_ACC=CAM_ASM_000836 /TAXON_ID=2866 /ORGANISM="Crypthecodinium cohnii, Strain Seligo" /LENGTH=931 /DNA_ID=CAMNT_0053919379 /DNA_START=104 /DNA_END=2899 /DNA_ORIENTATION=+